jgi:signal peptidase I
MDWLGQVSIGWVLAALALLLTVRLAVARKRVLGRAADGAATWLDSAVLALALVFLVLRPFVMQAFYIPSESMRSTLEVGDRILVNKLSYRFGSPQRGDVVVFAAPPAASPEGKEFIKRVVGLPGDTVAVEDGQLVVNGVPQREPYLDEPISYEQAPVTVPPGSYWVLGDNRNESNDSHLWGPLAGCRIVGRAALRFWPPFRVGRVAAPRLEAPAPIAAQR